MSTILLLHGIPGSAANWSHVIPLIEAHHDVIVPNLVGFAGSEYDASGDDLLAPSQARHVLELLDSRGIHRVAVVGHDFGGPVAAHLVASAPDRVEALALFATNAFPDTPIPFPLSLIDLPVLGPMVERLLFSRASLAMMVRRGTGEPKPDLDLADYLGDEEQVAAIRSIFSASLHRIVELYTPVEAALASVAVPALVGWGDRDPFFDVATGRRTAQTIPGARFVLYGGAGHFLPEERPEQLAADVLALVEEVEGGDPGTG
ncbi:MAG: alpha/beta hydrolase [Chloroflexota bacterium]|jgi:pimeloyl-ACP methyl ester carboxylesterase